VASLYLVTGIFILLGLVGWYVVHGGPGWWGAAGLALSIVGVALVRSSAGALGAGSYAPGAAVLLGVITLAACAWREKLVPAWVPGALLTAALLAPVSYLAPGPLPSLAASGVAFNAGLAGMALSLWVIGSGRR
jgi:hypothetical protein